MMPQAECSTSCRVRAVCVTIALATYSCCMLAAASESQQQQHVQPADNHSALRSLLMLDHNKKVQDEQQQAYWQQEKQKFELKRRLHKIVDEFVDTKLDEQQQTYPTQQAKRSSVAKTKKTKKWSSNEEQDKQQFGDDKIVIIVKQPVSDAEPAPLKAGLGGDSGSSGQQDLQNVANHLELDPSNQQQQQQVAASRRPKIDMSEHARRIMDDQFGIRRESLFSTNNHLGLKGVPKFGTEEEY